jgi:hypothetical protein
MLYHTCLPKGKSHFLTEPFSRCKLRYLTNKTFRERFAAGKYTVIGEIGGCSKPPECGDILLTEDGHYIRVLPRGSLRRLFEWVIGYIPVGENTYIAAVRSVLPSFLVRRKRIRLIPKGGVYHLDSNNANHYNNDYK